jgi:hypothetical protein
MKKIIVIAAITVAVAGCGGSSLPKDVTGAPKLGADAHLIGCRNLKPLSEPTMFAAAEGDCRISGRSVDLVTFSTDQARDNWEKAAETFGGKKIKDGPGWAAYWSL